MMYAPILATLGYVLSGDGLSVLMVHRNARPQDHAYGKYNGLGGKMEPGEDLAACMVREIREEAGIEVTSLRLRGTLSWPGFGDRREGWFGFVFLVEGWEGTPMASNPEGDLHWISIARLLAGELPMWEGDRLWLPMVFDSDPRPFHGVEPYDGLTVVQDGWAFSRM
ncbi:8-oxo-dGTP diphosphatase [Candidatus Amarobacter glycogenicus]|uniref:NUDIX hydrolase n=1 Tax=Candidatus Amarobacter glycogenicus TaxID=3140699 RepID=UPI002A127E55|nr:8-oxo-dGTP diphosphatase [Dehalococcoidia bacterium]